MLKCEKCGGQLKHVEETLVRHCHEYKIDEVKEGKILVSFIEDAWQEVEEVDESYLECCNCGATIKTNLEVHLDNWED